MQNQTPRVIKSGDVMLAGRRPIGSAAEGAAASRPGQASARIVAQDASGATLEIVCSCGKHSQVRCAYRTSSSQPAQSPAGQPVQSTAASDSQENPL